MLILHSILNLLMAHDDDRKIWQHEHLHLLETGDVADKLGPDPVLLSGICITQ